jgi:hypothetical protein
VALRGKVAGSAQRRVHAVKEVMHIARKNAGSSQSSDTRPRSAHLRAGAILLPCPRGAAVGSLALQLDDIARSTAGEQRPDQLRCRGLVALWTLILLQAVG